MFKWSISSFSVSIIKNDPSFQRQPKGLLFIHQPLPLPYPSDQPNLTRTFVQNDTHIPSSIPFHKNAHRGKATCTCFGTSFFIATTLHTRKEQEQNPPQHRYTCHILMPTPLYTRAKRIHPNRIEKKYIMRRGKTFCSTSNLYQKGNQQHVPYINIITLHRSHICMYVPTYTCESTTHTLSTIEALKKARRIHT